MMIINPAILIFILLFAVVFWLLMLIHATKHPIESKPLWIIIILLFGILGAVIYYFAVKRKFSQSPQTPPSASAV